MNGRKVLVATICLACISMPSWADVVYLKDGSVIKGKVIGGITGETCKIETADGSVFVFPMDKVERVKLEGEKKPEEEASPVDIVYLKDGSVIKGKIIEVSGDTCKIETPDGSLFVFTMDRIERIKFKKEAPPVEKARPVKAIPQRVEQKPALPEEKKPISVGFGLGSFRVEDVEGIKVKGRGMEYFGDIRYMVRENFAIQGELRKGKHSGTGKDEDGLEWDTTYEYLSYGVTGMLFFKPSPGNPLVLYGGGGVSRYNWNGDFSTEVYGYIFGRNYNYRIEVSSKENDWGYHFCGGAEYPISKNIFLWTEVRKIMGTIKKPKVTVKITRGDGVTKSISGNLENWDYGHMVFRGGLRISF